MSEGRQDEIMLEVAKLQRLIAKCCPEVLEGRIKEEPDSVDVKDETDALNRHRLNILQQASGKKKGV